MKAIRFFLLFVFSCSTIIPAAKMASMPIVQAKNDTENHYLQFEYTMAAFGSASYKLIEKKHAFVNHPFYELKPSQADIVDRIEDELYVQNKFAHVQRVLKFNKSSALDKAMELFKTIGDMISATFSPSSGLVLEQEKIEWLASSLKKIKEKYTTDYKPQFKKEGWSDWIKSLVALNRVTKHWNFAELGGIAQQAIPAAGIATGLYRAAEYSKKTFSDNSTVLASDLATQVLYLSASLALNSGFIAVQSTLAQLEKDKPRLLERDNFIKMKKQNKEFKKQVSRFATRCPKDENFSIIEGVHSPTVMKEMNFLNDWLKKPFSYQGRSRIAVMLYGEPGNGKDTIVRSLSSESGAPLITIDMHDFIPDQNGQVHRLINKLEAAEYLSWRRSAKSAIIFFNEVDEIIKHHKQALHLFLNLLGIQSNPHVRILYLFATNHINKVDPRMLRPGRFKSKLYVGPPKTEEQRRKFITQKLEKILGDAPTQLVRLLAQATDGLSIAAIEEALVNTFNNAIMTSGIPDIQSFLQEIALVKEVAYHSSEQIA